LWERVAAEGWRVRGSIRLATPHPIEFGAKAGDALSHRGRSYYTMYLTLYKYFDILFLHNAYSDMRNQGLRR
jgi:hypothetical protein